MRVELAVAANGNYVVVNAGVLTPHAEQTGTGVEADDEVAGLVGVEVELITERREGGPTAWLFGGLAHLYGVGLQTGLDRRGASHTGQVEECHAEGEFEFSG